MPLPCAWWKVASELQVCSEEIWGGEATTRVEWAPEVIDRPAEGSVTRGRDRPDLSMWDNMEMCLSVHIFILGRRNSKFVI